MRDDVTGSDREAAGVGRRGFLAAAGATGAALVLGPMADRAGAATGPLLQRQPDAAGAPAAEQLHLQFGADAARSMVASWTTPQRVARPRVRLGTPRGGHGTWIDVIERAYTEAISGETVYTYHAPMTGLDPSTDYIYEVTAKGARRRSAAGSAPARPRTSRSASPASATRRSPPRSGPA
jgi:hypothetical protein